VQAPSSACDERKPVRLLIATAANNNGTVAWKTCLVSAKVGALHISHSCLLFYSFSQAFRSRKSLPQRFNTPRGEAPPLKEPQRKILGLWDRTMRRVLNGSESTMLLRGLRMM